MLKFSNAAIEHLLNDPRSGIVSRDAVVNFILDKEEIAQKKLSIFKRLNGSLNKYYPDAGGIMVGFDCIRIRKKNTTQLNEFSTSVAAKVTFHLFMPEARTSLTCIVKSIEEDHILCEAHSFFPVKVAKPREWLKLIPGLKLGVQIDIVEHLAWQNPLIIGTILEDLQYGPIFEDSSESEEDETVIPVPADSHTKVLKLKNNTSQSPGKRKRSDDDESNVQEDAVVNKSPLAKKSKTNDKDKEKSVTKSPMKVKLKFNEKTKISSSPTKITEGKLTEEEVLKTNSKGVEANVKGENTKKKKKKNETSLPKKSPEEFKISAVSKQLSSTIMGKVNIKMSVPDGISPIQSRTQKKIGSYFDKIMATTTMGVKSPGPSSEPKISSNNESSGKKKKTKRKKKHLDNSGFC